MNSTDMLSWLMVPAIVVLVGGLLAAVWHPSVHTRSLIQHFAAGVILAALSVEVLPEIGTTHTPAHILLLSFGVGSLIMYGLKLWTIKLEGGNESFDHNNSIGLLLATFVDVAMDGFIIGAGFAAGGATGPILAIGLSVELLFLGLSLVSETNKGYRIVALTAALAVTVLASSWTGQLLLSQVSASVLGAVMAFSAAALLYLVTEELLIEAHAVEEKPFSTLILFLGFLIFWGVSLLHY